jgi:hypothetical protein
MEDLSIYPHRCIELSDLFHRVLHVAPFSAMSHPHLLNNKTCDEKVSAIGGHKKTSSILADHSALVLVVYEPKCGGGGGLLGLSQWVYTLYRCTHGAQKNFGDLTPYLTYVSNGGFANLDSFLYDFLINTLPTAFTPISISFTGQITISIFFCGRG